MRRQDPVPEPVAGPPSERGRWWLLAVLLAATILAPTILKVLSRETARSGAHMTTGYNRAVGLMAEHAWLVAHRDDADPDRRVVTVSGRIRAKVDAFYRQSFLRTDIEANDPALWRFSGDRGVKGVDPMAHSVVGPFDEIRAWRGDILYRDPPRREMALTASNGQRLVFLAPPHSWSPSAPRPPSVAVRPFVPALRGPDGDVTVRGGDFRVLDDNDELAVSLLQIGERVVVRVESGGPSQVLIDQDSIVPREGAVAFKRLDPGQTLHVRSRERVADYRLDIVANGLSTFTAGAGRLRAPGVTPLVPAVEAAMARLTQTGDPGAWADTTVHMAFDETLQTEAQRLLRAYSGKLRNRLKDPATFRAAALVMDARSGEVLAAASFPSELSDLAAKERYSTRARSMLTRDHNLTRLNIGSVAKIPFSMAILDTHPYLATLEVRGAVGKPFQEVLGQRLESPLTELSTLDPVGFEGFIQTSSNKYASALMLLASAPDPSLPGETPAGEGYWLRGRACSVLPRNAFTTRSYGSSTRLDRSGRSPTILLPWVKDLDRLFDLPHLVDVGSRGDEFSDQSVYDISPWRVLIGSGEEPGARGFLDASPEQESFSMGAINNLRNDYLQLALGGGRSRWTTVKVAEVFSRIVTGLKVRASFLATGTVEDRRTPFSDDPASVAARQRLLGAMELVWRNGGTAMYLGPRLEALRDRAAARGETVRVFAKTGTPTLERAVATPVNRVVNELIELRILRIDDFDTVSVLDAERDDEGSVRRALRGNPDAREILARYGVDAATVATYVQQLKGRGAHAKLIARDAEEGVYLKPDLPPERGDGGVIAFTIARYQAGRVDPVRALTVVINIQAKLPEEAAGRRNPATEMAEQWLAEPRLGQLLFDDRPPPSLARPTRLARAVP